MQREALRALFVMCGMSTMLNPGLITSLIVGAVVGAASAYLGSIMILKRMALVGDALSHVALPGIGLALTFQLNPFLGAFTALALGILLIWQIERRTSVPTEAIVGIIFTVALSIGILVTPEPELLEALFGDIAKVSLADAAIAAVFSLLIFAVMVPIKDKLVLSLLSPDLAKSQRINIDRLNLIFLTLVAVVVALGVKVAGTLLMGSLVVIPAAASKNLARSFSGYGKISLVFGVISAVAGILLASALHLPPGPLVVLSSASVFLITLFLRRD